MERKLNKAQEATLLALEDVGGWATTSQLVARGGNASSPKVLERMGLIEEIRVAGPTGFSHSEYRIKKEGIAEKDAHARMWLEMAIDETPGIRQNFSSSDCATVASYYLYGAGDEDSKKWAEAAISSFWAADALQNMKKAA